MKDIENIDTNEINKYPIEKIDPSRETVLPSKVNSLEGEMKTMLSTCRYLIANIVKIK